MARQTRCTSLGTDNFEAAQLGLAARIVERREPKHEEPADVALEDVLVRYYQRHATHIRSRDTTRNALAKWSDFFPNAKVSEVNLDAQASFVRWTRIDKGYSDGYIQRIVTAGKVALIRAYKNGEITTVPHINMVTLTAHRERLLSMDETAALFNAIDAEHVFMYCMLAFNTVSRPEAILELQRFQVDFDNRVVNLNQPGRATKKHRPVVPITDTLLPWLRGGECANYVHWRGRPIKSMKTDFTHL